MTRALRNRTGSRPNFRTWRGFWPVFVMLFLGCDGAGQTKVPDRPIPADQVTDFGLLFGQNCAGCHGADGILGPGPPLNDPLFLAIVPDEVLMKLVTEGRPGTPMPGFSQKKGGSLTDEQVRILATGLKPRWKTTQSMPLNLPEYTIAQNETVTDPKQGRDVFARACAGCHGTDGEGTTKAGKIHDPAFLALISDQALRRYVITGRPDLGMPSFSEKTQRAEDFAPLSSKDIANLVAFMADWRRGGAATNVVQERSESGTGTALSRRVP